MTNNHHHLSIRRMMKLKDQDEVDAPRRSTRQTRMPERFNDYIIAKCAVPRKEARDIPPRSYEVNKEIETLKTHGGMKVVPRPEHGEIVPTRTIFEEKLDNITGETTEKARVVARGDKTKLKKQKKKKKVDLKQIYSLVVSMIVVN